MKVCTCNINPSRPQLLHNIMNLIAAHFSLLPSDPQVLRFYGYFRQDVLHSPHESFRIRPVVVYYYLEDDSMCVMEPAVENSGIPQGKLIKRQRLTKNQHGELYHWKDLNLRMDASVFGTVYRITHCDTFTQVHTHTRLDQTSICNQVTPIQIYQMFVGVHGESGDSPERARIHSQRSVHHPALSRPTRPDHTIRT